MHKPAREETPAAAASGEASPLPIALDYDVRFQVTKEGLCLADSETEITLSGIDPERSRSLLDRLDGQHPIEALCEVSGLDEPACSAIISCLVDNGMAHATAARSAQTSLTGAAFARVCRDLIPAWKHRLFSHSLWRSLSSGEAPRGLFEGWLLENFHFIEGVTLRLSAAAAHCQDAAIRRHFIKHFAEEYDHCEFFRRSLAACGITPDKILESRPLAGTLAVLHFMRDAARKDPLCYAACSAFLESTGEDRHSAGDFFERLAENYEPKAVQFMAQHAQMDERYEHVGFLEKICREMNDIDMARADRAVRYLSGFVETLELWSTVVERHYSSNPPLPVGSVRIYGAPTAMTGERA